MTERRILDRLWTQPGTSYAAFAGKHLLQRRVEEPNRRKTKLRAEDVQNYLTQEPAYTQHAPRRKRFPKPFYNMSKLYHLVECDLIETGRVARFNDDVRYLLIAIECTSRKIFVVPMKDKTGDSSTMSFRHLLDNEFEEVPHTVRTDRGSEWKDGRFQRLLRERGIRHLYANNSEKVAMCERSIQTLQRRIHRYLTHNNTLRFLPVLEKIVKSINDSPHSSTGIAPNRFGPSDVYASWERYYKSHVQSPRPFRYSPGDRVRISRITDALGKAFRGTFTPQIYTVVARRASRPPTYELVDSLGEPVQGVFFEEELIASRDRPDRSYPVKDVVDRRRNPVTGASEVQVTWEGWPKKLRTWIPESRVKTTGTASHHD